MAFASQECSGTCADFAKAPAAIRMTMAGAAA